MTLLTKTEYALHRGVSKAYISKKNIRALLAPATEKDTEGREKINVEKADAILDQNTDGQRNKRSKPKGGRQAGGDGDKAAASPAPEENSYEATRRRHEEIKLENSQIDLEQKKGSLIFRDEVERACAAAGQLIREHLTARNRHIADKAATMTDARAIKAMLDEADRLMLETVSNDIVRKLFPQSATGGETTQH